MPSKEDLQALLERVREAKGPDRELDAAICLAIDYRTSYKSDMSGFYTASIDAAVALVERVLPGWQWLVRNDEDRVAFGNVYPTNRGFDPSTFISNDAYAPTAPLALLAALLSALLARPDAPAEGEEMGG